jgi:hypothetical protein
MTRRAVAGATALLLLARAAHAQSVPDSVSVPWSYSAWGGFARNSPDNLWGAERGRDVAVAGLRFVRHDPGAGRVAVDYILDVIPLAWMSMPRGSGLPSCDDPYGGEKPPGPTTVPGPTLCLVDPPVKTSAVGFGASPLGAQARLRVFERVQPFAAMNAGLLWFARPVPSERAAQLNFTAEIGTGLLIGRAGRPGLMLGYKFHHISNGGTAASNPGVDGHMLYAGVLRVPR